MRFFTKTLTSGSLTINAADSVLNLSVFANAATAASFSILGDITFQGIPSAPIQIDSASGVNYYVLSPASPIDGLTITWISGNVDVTLGF